MNLPFVLSGGQVALAIGVAAVVVGALYLLRERYRPVVVSYLPLWEESIKRSTPLALARRLRKLASLLVQMLIVALAVLAMSDPGWGERADERNVILAVDVSPSMGANDGREGGTRLDEARRFASAVARSLKEKDQALLVRISSTPLVARSWGKPDAGLMDAIEALALAPGEADVSAGVEFAAAALAQRKGARMWVLSDGAFGLSDGQRDALVARLEELAGRGIAIDHHRCGREADNVAITHFAMRQDLRDRIRVVGMLEVRSFSAADEGRPVPARVEVRAGGHPVLTRKLSLGQKPESIWLDLLTPPSREIEAVLTPEEPEKDRLAGDNRASVTLPEQTELQVLAVSAGNTYLQAALLLSPTWNVEWIAPGTKPAREGYDVVVLDGSVAMPRVKTGGVLAINPSGEGSPVATDGIIEAPTFETFDRDHPVIRWTNLYNVNVSRALRMVAEKKDRALASSTEGPLILLREPEGGPRLIVIGFDLAESDMPMRVAWPLFFLNAVHYLGGESLEVASSGVSPTESRIAPHFLAGARHFGEPPKAGPRRPPLWLVLVACATALFALEWYTYHRRITV